MRKNKGHIEKRDAPRNSESQKNVKNCSISTPPLKVIQLRPDSSENPSCSTRVPMDPDCSGMFDCISILKKIYFGPPTTPNSCISKIRSKYCVSFETVPKVFRDCFGTVPKVFRDCSKVSQKCFETVPGCPGTVPKVFRDCPGTVPKVFQTVFIFSKKSESDHVEKMPIELVAIQKKFSFS